MDTQQNPPIHPPITITTLYQCMLIAMLVVAPNHLNLKLHHIITFRQNLR